jgi:hypothetical protein
MSLEDVPRCQHVKVNGTQCGSPALRRRRHCYFHDHMLDGKGDSPTARRPSLAPSFPCACSKTPMPCNWPSCRCCNCSAPAKWTPKPPASCSTACKSPAPICATPASRPPSPPTSSSTATPSIKPASTALSGSRANSRPRKKPRQQPKKIAEKKAGNDSLVASAETANSEAAPSQPAPANVCRTKAGAVQRRAVKPSKDTRKRPEHVPMEETEESETPPLDLYFKIFGTEMRPEASAEAG